MRSRDSFNAVICKYRLYLLEKLFNANGTGVHWFGRSLHSLPSYLLVSIRLLTSIEE